MWRPPSCDDDGGDAALVRLPQRIDLALTLTAGLVLVAAAVAKLFLFDLAALDGVFR